jgi:predicted RND superfamily exporter protein
VKRFIFVLSSMVRRAPLAVLIGSLVLTGVFAFLVPQQEQAVGSEGFSPDSREFIAYEKAAEVFESTSENSVQVLVKAQSGDLLTAEGLRLYLETVEAINDSPAAELYGGRPGGDVVGFFDPTVVWLAENGIDPASVSDQQVKEAFVASAAELPSSSALEFLVSSRSDLAEPRVPAGLLVVYLNTSSLDEADGNIDEQLAEIEEDMADAVRSVSTGDISVEPFSFALFFSATDQFQREIFRLFLSAFLIILAILGFVFWIHPKGRLSRWAALRRASADVALALAVIMLSIVWMNGIGVLLGPGYLGLIGPFNEILQMLPILLVGLGVDYAIHLTARYREEIGGGADVVDSATKAARTVGVALVLATVTTAVGFLTNLVSPIGAIADFGVLATVGIGSAFVLMLTFVPATRILLDRRAERAGRLPVEAMGHSSERALPRLMGAASVFAERVPVLMLSIALIAGGLGAWGFTRLDTTFSFTDFVPEGSPLLSAYEDLAEDFGGGFGEVTRVLIEGDVATVASHNALWVATNNIGDTPDVIVLGGRALADSPLTVIFSLATPPAAGGDPTTYDAAFAEQAAALGLLPDLSVAPGSDVAALYSAAEQAAPDAMSRVLASENGDYRYIAMSIGTEAGEQRAMELRDNLAIDLAPFDSVAGVSAVATSDYIITGAVVEALRASQAMSIGLTIAAAMALLVVTFFVESRRPFLGVIAILPVGLVVLWVFGMMKVSGISFNPVTGMIAAIAIGIGVPYSIHIAHRYQEDRIRCGSPEEAIRLTMTHTGGALAGSGFTTVAGFGILVTSSMVPFQQFGQVVAYAIGFALVAAVLVLPSMLVLWDRWHRRRGEEAVDVHAIAEALAAD